MNWGNDCYEGDAEYWNKIVNFDTNILVDGENLLVLVGRDSLYQGGDNTTWLDCELDLRVQTWKDNQLILGDDVKFRIDFFNNESYNLSNVNISIKIDNLTFKNQTINIEKNSSYEWLVDWTPTRLGYHNVSAKVFNTSIEKMIHVGYYAYSLNFTDTNISTNIGESIEVRVEVAAEGGGGLLGQRVAGPSLFLALCAWSVLDALVSPIGLRPGSAPRVRVQLWHSWRNCQRTRCK